MLVRINVYLGSDDKSLEGVAHKVDLFIQMAKRTGSLVIEDTKEKKATYWSVGPALVIHAYALTSRDLIEKIRTELTPIQAKVGNRHDFGPHDFVFDCTEPDTLRNMPHAIRREMECAEDRHCPACSRKIVPVDRIQFCPHCGHEVGGCSNDELTICMECPSDKKSSSIYHHSYKNCPRCGRELQRLRDTHWFDWGPGLDEDSFLSGVPLDDVDLPSAALPKRKTDKPAK